MDPKLYMLFLLFGTIIALSHIDDADLAKVKGQLVRWRRRDFGLRRHKS
ncbi:MAG: hypothetical protein WCI56_08540 [Hyphomicrobiales bacterium]